MEAPSFGDHELRARVDAMIDEVDALAFIALERIRRDAVERAESVCIVPDDQ